jgi:hypothetical protein
MSLLFPFFVEQVEMNNAVTKIENNLIIVTIDISLK